MNEKFTGHEVFFYISNRIKYKFNKEILFNKVYCWVVYIISQKKYLYIFFGWNLIIPSLPSFEYDTTHQ